MNSYFRSSANADGELAESTITNPIDNNRRIVITSVKSTGLFTKLEKVLFFFFAI